MLWKTGHCNFEDEEALNLTGLVLDTQKYYIVIGQAVYCLPELKTENPPQDN